MRVRFVFFASVREAIGVDAEERDLPDSMTDIAQCLDWLSAQSDKYADAFADRNKLRFALDQHMAGPDAPIGHAKELAIFPPVTGG